MATNNHVEGAAARYVTVFLRLAVDETGQLLHGQVVTLDGVPLGRFRDWKGAIGTLRAWLAERYARS